MLFICTLLVAVWFAPSIIAQPAVLQQLPKMVLPQYPGTIEVGSASLGWLQPVVIRNVKATGADGHPLLDVKEFSTSEPLWKLAVSQANLGRLKLIEPQVSLEFRADGSNLEDVLQKLMSGPSSQSTAPVPDLELEIENATIAMDHKEASLSSTIKPISLLLQLKRGTVEEVELTTGQIPSKDEAALSPATDWLAFHLGNEPTQDGVAMSPGSKHIRLKAVGWNIDKLLPAIARFEPKAELAGLIDADARSQVNLTENPASWTDREWSCDGRITLRKFVLAGISALKQDRVTLETTSVAGRLAAQQGRLSMENAQIQTEVGELTATGDIPLAGFASASPANAAQSILGEQDYTVHGHLDLQRLAALLPTTLRIREGTEITGGRIDVNLTSEAKVAGTRNWTADAKLDQLAARNNGQVVALNQPVQLTMQAHKTGEAVTVDQITCQSDFLKLSGGGTLTDAKFQASADLTRLEENLQQFVDLGLEKLAGKIKIDGEIRRAEKDSVSLDSTIQLDNFQINVSKTSAWQEKHLVLTLNVAGTTISDTAMKGIESAKLKLTSGLDSLDAQLLQPVDLESKTAAIPVKARLEGDLHTWQNRLKPFTGDLGWQLGGTTAIDATVTADPKQIEVVNISGDINSLDARGAGLWIREPQVKLQTAGVWSMAQREWIAPETTVTGTAIACRIHELKLTLKADGQLEKVTGDAAYRGDLDKLSKWKNDALEMPSYTFMGGFEGRAHLAEQDSVISVDMETTVKKLVVADLEKLADQRLHWVALWREPEMQLTAKGTYNMTSDDLQMETASAQTDGLSLSLQGSLAKISTQQKVDLKGELGYDWEIVSQRLGDSVREAVQLTGKQKRPLTIKGTLASLSAPTGATGIQSPPDLTGNVGAGWDSAVIEGLAVGKTEIAVHIEQGVVQFAPIDTTVADGRMHLTPQIRLDQSPNVVILPQEKVLDQIQISPQLCNRWLKFVAPLLADSVDIDGKLSLNMQGGRLPLSAPMTGDLAGAVDVHHVKVKPGAGANQILGVIDQVKSIIQRKPIGNGRDQVLMQMPEHAIPFKLAGGRVYHQDVIFLISNGSIQSSGSVGMDESIDLVLQIPIKDEWLGDQKLLAALKGQSLKIPVRGTLTRPQIDSRVLGGLAAQIGGTALEGALENKLDNLLNDKLKKFLPK